MAPNDPGSCSSLAHPGGRLSRLRPPSACIAPTFSSTRQAMTAGTGAAGLHRGAGRAVRLLHQRHDHGVGRASWPGTGIRPKTQIKEALANNLCRCGTHARIVRAVKRASSGVREAIMNTHFKPSRRDLLKGGGALVVSFSFAPRSLGEALAQARAGSEAARARPRSTPFSRSTPSGTVHGLFRQGRPRHRRPHRAARRWPPKNSTCRSARVNVDRRATPRSRPTRAPTWGSLTIQIGGMQIRQAAATARGSADRAGREAASASSRGDLSVADGVIQRRRQARQPMAS